MSKIASERFGALDEGLQVIVESHTG